MDNTRDTITLYSAQADAVYDAIRRDGVCFSKAEYVRKKYGESGPIFLTAYHWFVKEAERLVPKPAGAEFPYWAFGALYNVETSGLCHVLTLRVPLDEVILFDMHDWSRIMQLKYMGENEQDEQAFSRDMEMRGLKETDIMLSNFYPEQKQKTLDSWHRLFRHHERLRMGNASGVSSVQAGLWRIKEDWIVSHP